MLKYVSALILSVSIFASCATAEAETVTTNTSTTTTTTPSSCDRACWEKIKQRQINERIYWAEVVKQQKAKAEAARIARIYAYAAAVEQARLARLTYPSGQCGGSLPPCSVMRRESGGDIRIWNGRCYAPYGWRGLSPCGISSASGKWQMVRGTWGGYGGYVNAADAPEKIQDDRARHLYAGGRGSYHWRL